MNDISVTIIQTNLFWEDVDKNLSHFDAKLKDIKESTDIIVLPEMFTTGFTMNPKALAEDRGGKGLQWLLQKAKDKNCVIVGSVSVKDKQNFYNRLYWAMPDGSYQFYDKRHLFQMGKEHLHYTAGTSKMIIDYKGWKICPLICYDLRFPVWSRNVKDSPYDLLIYVANWPAIRSYPWQQLLIARAIENQTYVIGVNRVGEDGNGIAHSGDSCILNPRGEVISKLKADENISETVVLSQGYLEDFRQAFPVLSDGDEFRID